MFLFVSKVLGVLVMASNILIVIAVAGALALHFKRRRLGIALVWTSVFGFLVLGFGPGSAILMRPLEGRFPRPPADIPEPTGIIVLGGVVGAATVPRGAIALSEDGERLTETATLAHRYPSARIVVSGGTLGSVSDTYNEALISKRFLVGLGVDENRITAEPRSLSTAENAAFTRELIMPQPGERWLLVTSASHMPRAVGTFRRVGFPVIPYPVGYTTMGRIEDYLTVRLNAPSNLERVDVAVHEWLGLIAYRLTGRIDALLPGPDDNERDIIDTSRQEPAVP